MNATQVNDWINRDPAEVQAYVATLRAQRDELVAALEMLATMCALPASNQQAHFISSGEHMTRYAHMRSFIGAALAKVRT